MKNEIIKQCKFCGKNFTPKSNHPTSELYCCKECKQHADAAKTYRYTYYCSNCGKELHRSHRCKGLMPVCSQQCLSEYRHKQNYEKRTCVGCGTIFECLKSSSKTFCSNNCHNKGQKDNAPRGKKHPSYNTDVSDAERTLECQGCHTTFVVDKPYKRFISKYCSHECKHAAMIYKARHEKTGEERVDTAPQKLLNKILDELHVQYQNEFACGCFSFDNYCIQEDLFIEVMGTYGHADIRKFTKINEVQKRDIIQDKRKRTYLFHTLKRPILYVGEDDLYHHYEMCKELVKQYLQKQGKLQNFHSYNYHIEDNNLKLNDELIIGYMDRDNDYRALLQS